MSSNAGFIHIRRVIPSVSAVIRKSAIIVPQSKPVPVSPEIQAFYQPENVSGTALSITLVWMVRTFPTAVASHKVGFTRGHRSWRSSGESHEIRKHDRGTHGDRSNLTFEWFCSIDNRMDWIDES